MSTEIVEYTQTEAALAELRTKYQGVVYEVATTKGMDAAKKGRAELRDLRVKLEKTRKDIKEPALRRCQLIDSEAKRITTELSALENPIDEQIKAEEERKEKERQAKIEADRRRVAALQERVAAIHAEAATAAGKPSAIIRGRLERIRTAAPAEEDFAEFHLQAVEAHASTVSKLETMLAAQVEQEAEQERIKAEREELERLRREDAERRAEQERIDRERREREEAAHRERMEAEALQRAEVEAEERRNREFQEAEARRVREAEEQARREEEGRQREAEEQRLQAERERLAEEQRQFEARQAEQRRKDEEARAQAEAERRANLTLRGAAQAVVEHFHGQGIAVVDDLAAALAKDEAQTGGKRQAAPVTRTPRRAVGE